MYQHASREPGRYRAVRGGAPCDPVRPRASALSCRLAAAAGAAAALGERRYGLVFTALIVVPLLFALCTSALAVAMLVGQETWLLAAASAVPVAFVVTAVVIGLQGRARSRGRATRA